MKRKGTWLHRFAVRLFTCILSILVFWTLGFFVEDIRSIPGPLYDTIENKYLNPKSKEKHVIIEKEIVKLNQLIENQTEKQNLVKDSSLHLQQTINQLLELQRLSIEKNIRFSDTEQENFSHSLSLFLDNQKIYQQLSQDVSDKTGERQVLFHEKEQVEREMEQQRQPAKVEFDSLTQNHHIKLALFQLAILLPLLSVAALLIIKNRSSLYIPVFLAFGGATLLKVILVVHEYFPSHYFKYILIISLLLVVVRLLVYFIQAIAFPKTPWLLHQYREAYERFLCPVCEYPIRIGPRRFLFWTRRTVHHVVTGYSGDGEEEKYTCPFCGSSLFEECLDCRKVRHTLLPYCSHCGGESRIHDV